MAKGTSTEVPDASASTPKKSRLSNGDDHLNAPAETPSHLRSILKVTEANGDITPRTNRKVLFTGGDQAATNGDTALPETPLSKAKRLDGSARRKSNKRLLDQIDEDGEGDVVATGELALAQEILSAQNGTADLADLEDDGAAVPDTPSKKTKATPKPRARRKEKSPTPPDNLPPHELFFFQNRTGGTKTSTNTFASGALLSHEDYFNNIKSHTEPHKADIDHLSDLHEHSFDQWAFELDSGFSICLYGYGSKRHLINDLAAHLHDSSEQRPTILIVNGYNASLTPKDILTTLASALLPATAKPPAQLNALLDTILAHITTNPPRNLVYLFIHSIDARPLRKHQGIIARLASHPAIRLLATADTPTFPLLWPLPLLSQLRFIYHDTTTFLPYDAEIDTVDEVNTLLGKSGRRVGGKDGVTFVLRSLPENARNLFRILVAEQLSLMDAGIMSEEAAIHGGGDEDDEDRLGFEDDEMDLDEVAAETPSKTGRGRKKKAAAATPKKRKEAPIEGVEYRTLYHKAVEEFVCSSEMGFRTLLKEFYDHQIVESRKDGLGGERLVVPFGRGELEALLEELI